MAGIQLKTSPGTRKKKRKKYFKEAFNKEKRRLAHAQILPKTPKTNGSLT